MSRSISKKTLLGGLATAGVLAAGIAAPAAAFAEPSTPVAGASGSPNVAEQTGRVAAAEHPDGLKRVRVEVRDEFAAALAEELGVPKEKVEAALEKIRKEHLPAKKVVGKHLERFKAESKAEREAQLKTRLDEAVAQGKLTREQADAIVKAFEAGVLPGLPMRVHIAEPDAGTPQPAK